MVLTTNLLLVSGCKWFGSIPLPSFCTCIGILLGDLYRYGTVQNYVRITVSKQIIFTYTPFVSIYFLFWF